MGDHTYNYKCSECGILRNVDEDGVTTFAHDAELAALRAVEQAARAFVASHDPVGTGEQPAEWVLHGIASARDKTREAIEALDRVRGGTVERRSGGD